MSSINIDTTTAAQRSLQWFRERWGKFTGSKVAALMGCGRKKGDTFSATARAYICQVAAERMFNPAFLADDEVFQSYLDTIELHSRAVQWGIEQEDSAKSLFMRLYHPGKELIETSSCPHPALPFFAASPDGIVRDFDDQGSMLAIEIKCPQPATFVAYRDSITDGATLKVAKPEYYWQVLAEMACTGAEAADFVAYCPWLSTPLHVVRILPDPTDTALMLSRVELANAEADRIAGLTPVNNDTTDKPQQQ